MPTTRFVKDLWMLQETANGNLEVGSDLVRKSDIDFLFEKDIDGNVDWEAMNSALLSWEAEGYIKILSDPRTCKYKDYCFQILKPINAVPQPPDLLET